MTTSRFEKKSRLKSFLDPAVWSPLVAFSLLAFLFAASPGVGQIRAESSPSPTMELPDRAPSQLMCSISAFFSFDQDDIAGVEGSIEGRGLATCTNDQGFQTELPVAAVVDASVAKDLTNAGEVAFSANTSLFVVPRDVHQIEDQYEIRHFSWTANQPSNEPLVVFRGTRHDLVIETKFASQTGGLDKIEIKSIRFRFDDAAPTLED